MFRKYEDISLESFELKWTQLILLITDFALYPFWGYRKGLLLNCYGFILINLPSFAFPKCNNAFDLKGHIQMPLSQGLKGENLSTGQHIAGICRTFCKVNKALVAYQSLVCSAP